MSEINNPSKQAKKRYNDSKQSLNKENTELRIENEVIKRQLISIRGMIDNILGENYIEEIEKLQKKAQKCHNCQKIGDWGKGFCPDCLES